MQYFHAKDIDILRGCICPWRCLLVLMGKAYTYINQFCNFNIHTHLKNKISIIYVALQNITMSEDAREHVMALMI
jgi:hypothetical protein